MPSTHTPPFRAEHVGSLLRPAALLEARERLEGDQYAEIRDAPAYQELKNEEDRAIREAVALQEAVGLQVITDGEFRRRSWYQDFVLALDGTAIRFGESILGFKNEAGEKLPSHLVVVEDKLKRPRGITTDAFTFLKAQTKRTPKATMPSPSR